MIIHSVQAAFIIALGMASVCADEIKNKPFPGTPELKGRTHLYFYKHNPDDNILATHNGKLLVDVKPAGIPLLDEPNIQTGIAVMMKYRDVHDEVVGFATELEYFIPVVENGVRVLDMPSGKFLQETFYTLVIPGRGTLFLHEIEDNKPLAAQIMAPVKKSGLPWEGDFITTSTVGPHASGAGVVIGGQGEFEGARGTWTENAWVKRYTPDGLISGSVELHIALE